MISSAPLLWLLLGGLAMVLVVVGLDGDGFLLIVAVAGLLLTLVSSLLPLAPLLQVLLFLALAGSAYAGLRQWAGRQGSRAIPPAAGADQAEVIVAFDANGEGRVRWKGQSWAALNLDPLRPLSAGDQVMVMGREGTRLQVLPR